MKDNSLGKVNEYSRTRFVVVLATLGVLFGIAVTMGDLDDQLTLLGVVVAILVVPLFVIHQFYCRRQLQPLHQLRRQLHEAAAPRAEALVRRVLSSLETFPIRATLVSLVLWLGGALIVVSALVLSGRWTGWQILVVLALAFSGGLIDTVFSYRAFQAGMGPIRIELEGMLPEASGARPVTGRLSRRIVIPFLAVLLLALGLGSLTWLGMLREQKVEEWSFQQRAAFQAVAAALESAVSGKTDGIVDWREAIEKAGSAGGVLRDLVVLGAQGDVLWKSPGLAVDPVWLSRISEIHAGSWRDLRTPFLFLARRVSPNHLLVTAGPMSWVYDQIGSLVGRTLLVVVLVTLLSVILAWSVTGLALRPLGVFTEQLRRQLAGPQSSASLGDEGEIPTLIAVTTAMIASVRKVVSAEKGIVEDLQKGRCQLIEQMRFFVSATEHRSELAVQTATSVHQMQSSIQSTSEQLESLREVSSDCSSAMFEIDQSVKEAATSSENLQTLVDDTVSSMTQITVSMEQVIKNVDELARAAENTLASLSVMDASIKQVEDGTHETHRLSGEMTEIASRGAESVRQTIAGIGEIQEVTDEARSVINRLGTQMEAVGKILTVISDVAEQTNLLALNAAIIAAAAGEHGKGFAVVADEIKDLADRTSSSTKEIAGLIKAVQTESRHAVDAMERGSGSVRRGVDLANIAGEALQQILASVRQASETASAISKSSSEHINISRNIGKSMADVSNMVREIKRTVAEQSRSGSRVNRVSEQMREDARFVFRSANEQVQAANNVAHNMERITEMVSFISKAIAEQSQGVGHVAKVAEDVCEDLQQEKTQLANLQEIANDLDEKARKFLGCVEPIEYLAGEKNERN